MVKCPRGTNEQINANLAYLKMIGSRESSDSLSEEGSKRGESGELGVEGDAYLSGVDLDIVRADKRCPPTTEDEIIYLFVNHFLDILLKSWDGTPCLKPKLAEPTECLNTDQEEEQQQGEEEDVLGQDVNRSCERPPSLSLDYLNDLHKSKSQNVSKTYTPLEGRLSEMCKKQCESRKSAAANDEESRLNGEDGSESELSWKALVPDEEVNMSFQNGAWYKGRVSRRLMDGDGAFFWEDGGSYQGEFINGTATGFGKLEFPNLAGYEGTVYKGFRHGEGLHYMYDSSVMYSGEWWLGKKNGNGIIFYDDPVRCLNFYKGSWLDGKKDGFGFRQYPSGSKYVGFWQNGKRHGTGIMFWCNHDIYKGEWKNGLMDGYGEYIWNGFVNKTFSCPRVNTYRGFWENGKRNGVGLLELMNGSLIETVWVENEKNGPGAAICPNGSVVVNNNRLFKNDKPALLNPEEEDLLGLLLRNQGFQMNRKKYARREIQKLPDEAQLLSFMNSMEKAKAISIPIHTPVHSLDLGCHVKRLIDQKTERHSAEKLSDPQGSNQSAEFFTHEEKLLRYSIMINLIRLKECYEEWAMAACEEKPSFSCILLRIFFWEMLIRGEVPRRNFSLVDIDKILDREESFLVDFPHEPFEKIQLWQFIQFLITISWYLYGRYVHARNLTSVHKNVAAFLEIFYNQNERAILAPAFTYFLQTHIFDLCCNNSDRNRLKHRDLVPFEAMYMVYKKVGEPHSAKQFLNAVFKGEDFQLPWNISYYFEAIPHYRKIGQNVITFTNELSYFQSEHPFNYPKLFPMEKQTKEMNAESELTCFAELRPKGLVNALIHVCPNIFEDGLIVDMEYQLTFLEFYKVVIKCAEMLLRKRALKSIQSEIISNYKKELEEYDRLMEEYEKQKEAATVVTKKVSNVKKNKK